MRIVTTNWRRKVRAVFLSDTHLGWRFAQAHALLDFLKQYEPEYLYLVGDFMDGWSLKRKWHWRPEFTRVIQQLMRLGAAGTQIRYTPGNHDEFLRQFLDDFGFIELADEFTHRAADGREFLVLHGDQFDDVELRVGWLSGIGSRAYEWLIAAEHHVNRVRKHYDRAPWHLTGDIKRRVKKAVCLASDFERRLAEYTREQGCTGVICGHIHTPRRTMLDGIEYFNTGDWVENCTAVLEYHDGHFELLHWPSDRTKVCEVRAQTLDLHTAPPQRAVKYWPGLIAAVD